MSAYDSLQPVRRAAVLAHRAARILDGPAARTTHDRALADLRSALLDLQDAAEDAYVSLPEGVSS